MQDTLNMLRIVRRNAKLSAYEEVEGPFDFNKTPMSILGTKGLAYLAPDDRATWQPRGVDAFYTGRKPIPSESTSASILRKCSRCIWNWLVKEMQSLVNARG